MKYLLKRKEETKTKNCIILQANIVFDNIFWSWVNTLSLGPIDFTAFLLF